MTKEFQDELEIDPLLLAEKITGKSYKDDKDTSALGMLLHMAKNEIVREEMSLRDDTHWSSHFADTVRIYTELGFETVYREEFQGNYSPETFLVLWRGDGLLAVTESYGRYNPDEPATTNSNTLYANWLPNQDVDSWEFTSTGHYNHRTPTYNNVEGDPWIWVGNWDMRTGMRNIIDRLEKNGTFIAPWLEQPLLHLNHYGNKSALRDKLPANEWLAALDAERDTQIARLPQHVQDAIAGQIERHRKMSE